MARFFPVVLLASFLLINPVPGQSAADFATRVVSFSQGSGGGNFTRSNALGPPSGAGLALGSTQVLSLGVGGSLVLGFKVTICDGPGDDFIVFENPFLLANSLSSFAELAALEVSTNGVDFARLPGRYLGPAVSPGPYGGLALGHAAGLAGAMPVLPASGRALLDPCQAGGDSFDLADLAGHQLVTSRKVDLDRINYIRIIDMKSGWDRDSRGRVIYDPGDGCDIDAVGVINHRGNQAAGAPRVTLARVGGRLHLTITDPQGLADIDPAELHASLFGIPVDPTILLFNLVLVRADASSLVLALPWLPPSFPLTIGFSLRDRQGNFAATRRSRL